jgi:hypothetical protein
MITFVALRAFKQAMNHRVLIISSRNTLNYPKLYNPDKISRNPDKTADLTADNRFYPDNIRINRTRIEALARMIMIII